MGGGCVRGAKARVAAVSRAAKRAAARGAVSAGMVLGLLCAGPAPRAQAAGAKNAGSSPAGEQVKCATKPTPAMLDGAEPATHEFHEFPANRSTESGTFSDGGQLDIEVTGCAGPVVTKMVLALPAPAAAEGKATRRAPRGDKADKGPERKTVGPLVDYLTQHQDAFIKTPLGLPGTGRALAAINEGRMSYPAGDRICLDKDTAVVVPEAQRCQRVLIITWSAGPKKTYTATYQAEP